MPKEEKQIPLIVFILWRILLFGTLLVGLIFVVRFSLSTEFSQSSSLNQSPPTERIDPVGKGNQLKINGALIEVNVGSGEKDLAAYRILFEKQCKERGGTKISDKKNEVDFCKTPRTTESTLALQDQLAVTRDKNGIPSYSHLSPKDELLLSQVMSTPGKDTPGFDVEDVPRFPEMDRYMAFEDPSGQYQTIIYGGGNATVKEVLLWMKLALQKKGWKCNHRKSKQDSYLFATKQGDILMVRSHANEKETSMTVSVSHVRYKNQSP